MSKQAHAEVIRRYNATFLTVLEFATVRKWKSLLKSSPQNSCDNNSAPNFMQH